MHVPLASPLACLRDSKTTALISMQFAIMLELILVFVTVASVASDEELHCITSPPDKDHPSPEPSIAQGACGRYSAFSCCTPTTAARVDQSNATDLENLWPICGEVSDRCLRYLRAENCFYFCEPYVEPWKGPFNGSLSRVPICASYCDEWFDACKNDSTCSSDWLETSVIAGQHHCDANQTCQTIATTFTNGKNLCNTMWGTEFAYDEDNTNCMTMIFTGKNPNADVTSEKQGTTGTTPSTAPTAASATPGMSIVALSGNVVLVWAIVCGSR